MCIRECASARCARGCLNPCEYFDAHPEEFAAHSTEFTMLSILTAPISIVDVGANKGIFTLELLQRFSQFNKQQVAF